MKTSRFFVALLLLMPCLALFQGCGGGGSSGSPATPTPVPTATVGGRVLVVQLRDSAGKVVDGIVTVGGVVLATRDGDATFNRNLTAGAVAVSAEVDGEVSTATATVKTAGTTVFTLLIAPRITPVPTATLPPPPFPN